MSEAQQKFQLRMKRCTWSDNPGGGDCFHHAAIDGMKLLGMARDDIPTMRKKMAAHVRLQTDRVLSGLASQAEMDSAHTLFTSIVSNACDGEDPTFGFLKRTVSRMKLDVCSVLQNSSGQSQFRKTMGLYATRMEETKLWASGFEMKALCTLHPMHVLSVRIRDGGFSQVLFHSKRTDSQDAIIVIGNYEDKHYTSGGVDDSKNTHKLLIGHLPSVSQALHVDRWCLSPDVAVNMALSAICQKDEELRTYLDEFKNTKSIPELSRGLHNNPTDTPLRKCCLSKFKTDAKFLREGKLPDCVGMVNRRPFFVVGGKHRDGKNFVEHSISTASQMFHARDVVDCVHEMKTRPMRKTTTKLLKRKKWKKMKKLKKKVKKTLQKMKENNEPMPAE